jgi:hypothetical protein
MAPLAILSDVLCLKKDLGITGNSHVPRDDAAEKAISRS